jgi:hypothetical protein
LAEDWCPKYTKSLKNGAPKKKKKKPTQLKMVCGPDSPQNKQTNKQTNK